MPLLSCMANRARTVRDRARPAALGFGANDSAYRIMSPGMRTLKLKVKPGSREESLVEQDDGTWLARVKAPPVDGKANAAVIALVASILDCVKRRSASGAARPAA